MNLYGVKEPLFHGSPFNHFYWYEQKFNTYPNFFESRMRIKPCIVDKIKKLGAEQIFIHNADFKKKKENKEESNLISVSQEIDFVYNDSLIMISLSDSYNYHYLNFNPNKDFSYSIRIFYQNEKTLDEIKNLFEYEKEKNKKSINLLCRIEGELTTQKFEVKLPQKNMDLQLNYGESLVKKTDSLVSKLDKNESGLALFSGCPGTGKSTYIKYLSTLTSRKIIYLPSTAIEEITSPDFLTFMIDYKNSILLLEDAEKVLKSREIYDNPGISNILNLSDGLLGDCLSVFVIATFNTTRDQIDPALLRKGRLVLEHEFEKLPTENCNKIFNKLKLDKKTTEPMTLAEIYNNEDNYSKKEEKRRVGF